MAKRIEDPRALAVWSKYRVMVNRAELARRLGISGVSVHNWRVVPEHRLADVSHALGVPMDRLRPDLADNLPGPSPWDELK